MKKQFTALAAFALSLLLAACGSSADTVTRTAEASGIFRCRSIFYGPTEAVPNSGPDNCG